MSELWARWLPYFESCGEPKEAIALDGYDPSGSYLREPIKILFVLREPNQSGGCDLRDQLASGARYGIWRTVARWAAGILSSKGFPPYDQADVQTLQDHTLKRIAVINLKKKSGLSTSDPYEINAWAHRDRQMLREQVRCLAPHLVVGCGTYPQLTWLLKVEGSHPITADTWGSSSIEYKCHVLDWYHPARHGGAAHYLKMNSAMAALTTEFPEWRGVGSNAGT